MGIEPTPEGKFRWRPESGGDPVVEAFHAVRRMTYASTGSRDPADLVRDKRGACTAKHVLLAQLLASLDVPCRVRCIAGAFGRSLPEAADMPDELRTMIRGGGVPDIHNVIVATLGGDEIVLDATWHDALIAAGFPVNHAWAGAGDTIPAVAGRMLEDAELDPIAVKNRELAALSQEDRDRRLRFLELITHYSAARQNGGGGA